jgi:hypothetical protein
MQREERPAAEEPSCGSGAAEGSEAQPGRPRTRRRATERDGGTTAIPQGMPVSPEEFDRLKRAAERPQRDPDPASEDKDASPPRP